MCRVLGLGREGVQSVQSGWSNRHVQGPQIDPADLSKSLVIPNMIRYTILVALIGGVEMRIATYEIAFCFHILLLSLLTVGRFRVSVSPTNDNCPGVNQLEGGMFLVPCSTFLLRLWALIVPVRERIRFFRTRYNLLTPRKFVRVLCRKSLVPSR